MLNENLINELQTHGMRLIDPTQGHQSRRGGAGPSDHKAVTIDGHTIMVPVHTAPAFESPFIAHAADENGEVEIFKNGKSVAKIVFPDQPKFYALETADGIPYNHIATLHGRDVLATTILQTCIRYQSRTKTCQFCAIGQSLAAGRTIAHKTPEQLGEVAKAAVELDNVSQMILTTGTPAGDDRGAKVLCESALGIKAAVDIPIQGQCEPPKDHAWFQRMKEAGIDALGMHLEVLTTELRDKIMPGKAQITLDEYYQAFKSAVAVFGRGQVSTYILAGLGDTKETILEVSDKLLELGVYPFVVPFVPVAGTPLESHPVPSAEFMDSVLKPLSIKLLESGILSANMKAGCAKCGACSSLSSYEKGGQSVCS